MTSAKKSIIPEFEEKISMLNADDHFNVNQTDISNKLTGSEVIFAGLKTGQKTQTASLKSLHGINVWCLDEAEEETDEDRFDKVDLSVRKPGATNMIILIMNPTSKEHWIWQRWFEGYTKHVTIGGYQIPVSTHPELCHIHTTYLDNINNIPDDYLKRIDEIKEKNPEKYRHVILGGWVEKAEGVIFDNWVEGEFDESLPYGFGLDFGYSVDPDALIKVAIDEKRRKIYLKEYLYENGLGSEKLQMKLKRMCAKNEIIADCAEPRLIDDLKPLNIKPSIKGQDSVRAGIKILLDYELVVDPDSHNLKKELNNYVWSDKKSDTPIDMYNHLLDACRYYVFTKLKRKQEMWVV